MNIGYPCTLSRNKASMMRQNYICMQIRCGSQPATAAHYIAFCLLRPQVSACLKRHTNNTLLIMRFPRSVSASLLPEYHTTSCSTGLDNTQPRHPDPPYATQPPPEPCILEILRMATFRGDLADVSQRISDAVTGHTPTQGRHSSRPHALSC